MRRGTYPVSINLNRIFKNRGGFIKIPSRNCGLAALNIVNKMMTQRTLADLTTYAVENLKKFFDVKQATLLTLLKEKDEWTLATTATTNLKLKNFKTGFRELGSLFDPEGKLPVVPKDKMTGEKDRFEGKWLLIVPLIYRYKYFGVLMFEEDSKGKLPDLINDETNISLVFGLAEALESFLELWLWL